MQVYRSYCNYVAVHGQFSFSCRCVCRVTCKKSWYLTCTSFHECEQSNWLERTFMHVRRSPEYIKRPICSPAHMQVHPMQVRAQLCHSMQGKFRFWLLWAYCRCTGMIANYCAGACSIVSARYITFLEDFISHVG